MMRTSVGITRPSAMAMELPRLKENVPGYIPWLYKLQITEQFSDITISRSMFRQSKRREV